VNAENGCEKNLLQPLTLEGGRERRRGRVNAGIEECWDENDAGMKDNAGMLELGNAGIKEMLECWN
jgi:hypothetical protein